MLPHSDRILIAFAFLFAACATSEASKKKVFPFKTAKQNYELAQSEMKKENYEEAEQYFSLIKQKFPFSKFAALSELGLADVAFARGGYQEAVDGYQAFQRLHPTHEKVMEGYVAFRIAESYVKEMPEDWVIFPPSYEKDQTAVRDALRELDGVLEKYPDSPYIKKAKEFRREVLQRLVAHEVYVARFYLEGGHPKAATLRIETALRRYPDSGRDTDLLLALGETQLEMGLVAKAKQSFLRVVRDFQVATAKKRAELFLDFIERRYGSAPVDTARDS